MNGLPDGWRTVELGEVATPDAPIEVPANLPTRPFVGLDSVAKETGHLLGLSDPSDFSSKCYVIDPGVVLYSRLRPYLNKVLLPQQPMYVSREFIPLCPHDDVRASFLAPRLRAQDFVEFAIGLNSGDRPRVKWSQMKHFELGLPPIAEQETIVRILDTQLARLDTVIEAVQTVRDKADQFRRSLLQAAFTGQLTRPDPSRGDELPESWSPMTIVQALEFSIGGVWGSEPGSDEVDVDVIRVTELKAHGRIDPSSSARRSITSKQLASRRLHEGDLLLEKSGGGPKTPVGRVGLVPRLGGPSVCANFMMLMRTDLSVVRPKFMHLLLNHLHREGVTAPLQKATTNIRNLKTKDYLDLPLRLPQLDEQDRLLGILGSQLGRLDGALSVADRVEAECGRLRRSLLQAAFTGELTRKWREANG